MAFPDPIELTIDSVATEIPRLQDGEFRTTDGQFSVFIDHETKNRYRSVIRLRDNRTVSSPMVPDQNVVVSAQASFTLDMPKNGYDTDWATDLIKALAEFVAINENAEKLIGGQE